MITEDEDFFEEEDPDDLLADNCHNCGREYDEIDHEYQICTRCGFDAMAAQSN